MGCGIDDYARGLRLPLQKRRDDCLVLALGNHAPEGGEPVVYLSAGDVDQFADEVEEASSL